MADEKDFPDKKDEWGSLPVKPDIAEKLRVEDGLLAGDIRPFLDTAPGTPGTIARGSVDMLVIMTLRVHSVVKVCVRHGLDTKRAISVGTMHSWASKLVYEARKPELTKLGVGSVAEFMREASHFLRFVHETRKALQKSHGSWVYAWFHPYELGLLDYVSGRLAHVGYSDPEITELISKDWCDDMWEQVTRREKWENMFRVESELDRRTRQTWWKELMEGLPRPLHEEPEPAKRIKMAAWRAMPFEQHRSNDSNIVLNEMRRQMETEFQIAMERVFNGERNRKGKCYELGSIGFLEMLRGWKKGRDLPESNKSKSSKPKIISVGKVEEHHDVKKMLVDEPDPLQLAADAELHAAVHRAVDELPHDLCQVVRAWWEEWELAGHQGRQPSKAKAARRIDVKPDTFRDRLDRAFAHIEESHPELQKYLLE